MERLERILAELRQLDKEAAQLFSRRMQVVEQLADYKQENQLCLWDELQPQQAQAQSASLMEQPHLRSYFARYLANQRHLDRQFEAQICGRNQVAYAGLRGCVEGIAAQEIFPAAAHTRLAQHKQVVQAVADSKTAYGVLPFSAQWSSQGNQVLDLLYTTPGVYICHQLPLELVHHLVAPAGISLSQVRRVLGHPKALAQSGDFLESLGVELVQVSDAAQAAQLVSQSQGEGLAAVATRETAKAWGLTILAENIQGGQHCTSPFIGISRRCPNQGNRFCLLLTFGDELCQLPPVMELLEQSGASLLGMERRSVQDSGETYWYLELEGTSPRPLVEELKPLCKKARLLGVYTRI